MASQHLTYFWQYLSTAVDHLAAGDETLRERLTHAMLDVGVLDSQNLPEPQRRMLDAITAAGRQVAGDDGAGDVRGGGGSVRASVAAMAPEQLERIAKQFVRLYAWVASQLPNLLGAAFDAEDI